MAKGKDVRDSPCKFSTSHEVSQRLPSMYFPFPLGYGAPSCKSTHAAASVVGERLPGAPSERQRGGNDDPFDLELCGDVHVVTLCPDPHSVHAAGIGISIGLLAPFLL